MSAYTEIKVSLRFYADTSSIVEEVHDLLKAFGMTPVCPDEASYERAKKQNQKCFDENIIFEKFEHARFTWKCDEFSFVDTMPCISEEEYEGRTVYTKEIALLFPEEEVTPEKYSFIARLMGDFYRLDAVYSVSIIKEE